MPAHPRLFWLFAVIFGLTLFASLSCDDDDDDDNNDDTTDDDDDDDDNNDDNDDNDTTDDDNDTADDDDDTVDRPHLLPGPNEPGYDADLEAKADRYDRAHLLFNCSGQGINGDVVIALANEEDRTLVEEFIQDTDSWDFETFSGGLTPLDVITEHHKVAGLYAGVGIAADAYRYGVLREQGYPQDDVDRARDFLDRGIEGLFRAVEITGVPGVIARGFCNTEVGVWCGQQETTPLFDEYGNPLPPEKNNGTWREDNSVDHRFPTWKWEDSCSRDQFIGWASAIGAIWEVIRDDDAFDPTVKATLQQYAKEIGYSLMVERTGGPGSFGQAFDLEIFDADNRTTYHGYINENAWDRFYLAWLPIKDGFYTMMSMGILGALTYCAEDGVLDDYFYNELLGERRFDEIAYNQMLGVNLGRITNYSATNMAMAGALLAQRYINDPATRNRVRAATMAHIYETGPNPLQKRQPEEYAYSLFDFTYAAAVSRASAFNLMTEDPDFDAVERGVQTLHDYAEAPYWDYFVENCDEAEIESGHCVLNNGQDVTVLGYVGRKGTLICEEPIPQIVRPPSNYRWRSCPYEPNGGGDGSGMLPGVDFRWAYWYARWVQ
jgi:hypothetical protein